MVGVDRSVFWDALGCALDAGLGVLVSRTSDGGALSIIIYDGDDRSRGYASNEEELAEVSRAIVEKVVDGQPKTQGPSVKRR